MKIIRTEEYGESYINEVNFILSKDKNYLPKISSAKHSLLLLEDQTIIGIGSIWDNFIHPYREYISVYIVPDKRYKGLGNLLYNELKSRYQLRKLQAAFDSDNINAVTFAIKCGFQLGRKSYCYHVNKEVLKPFNYNISGEIIKLSNLSKTQLENVIILQHKDYKLNHRRINPLNENIKIEDWKKIICKDLEEDSSYIFVKNNNIVAYLFCYEIDERSIAVGYTGSRCSNIKDYEAFLYEVVVRLFESWGTYIKDSPL